jgi:hypothetical protein
MHPARAFLASMSVSLMVLTLSYQAAAVPAALTPPTPQPKSDAWMNHAAVPSKMKAKPDDMSELVPLVDEAA